MRVTMDYIRREGEKTIWSGTTEHGTPVRVVVNSVEPVNRRDEDILRAQFPPESR